MWAIARTSFILLVVVACSREPSEAQLRPPPHWVGELRSGLSTAAHLAEAVSRDASSKAHASLNRGGPLIAAPALAGAVRFSRVEALKADPQAIPDPIAQQLAPYFNRALLARVRWVVAGRRLSLGSALAGWSYDEARLSFQRGEGAVTLEDVIVFSDRDLAENVWLWAHELTHVQQYQRLGVDQFAAQYVANWPALEAEATANAFRITAAIRSGQASGQPSAAAKAPRSAVAGESDLPPEPSAADASASTGQHDMVSLSEPPPAAQRAPAREGPHD